MCVCIYIYIYIYIYIPHGKESTEVWKTQKIRLKKGNSFLKKWRGLQVKGTSKLKEHTDT